jgi:hypothetical protein
MSRRWQNTYHRDNGELAVIHTMPVADLREHREHEQCWCRPRVELVSRTRLVVHHAADGRELVERHGLQ